VISWQGISTVLLDVDGVLTDGILPYSSEDRSQKRFHVRDGSMIKAARAAGLTVGIVSGRDSAAVDIRAHELGIDPVYQGVADKIACIGAWCLEAGRTWEEVAYIGDDLPDVPVLQRVGLPFCVGDASPVVKRWCRYVATTPGGRGAVGECLQWLLRAQGRWRQLWGSAVSSYHG
jgi:3-deoxy-D-manno-octulosonate 8-phosphate phosphatase (KDO 8-P phosphatase)